MSDWGLVEGAIRIDIKCAGMTVYTGLAMMEVFI